MELNTFLSELGLHVADPLLDGQIHRVGTADKPDGDVGWYVGWEAPYKIVIAGDWRTGLRSEWKGHAKAKLNRDDEKRVKLMIAEAKRASEWERAEKNRKAADEAREIVKQAQVGPHPYLTKKKIDTVKALVLNGYVIVPLSDHAGKVQGLQQIPVQGKKLFLTGQKSAEMAHVIPGDTDHILICEGYATGCTLWLATGYTVYCAMSASNLVKVAEWVRKRHHSAAITVCGDDDQWKPETGNAGRMYAMEAAELAQASVVFPRFESLTDEPTDFNDLHCAEGLATVGDQVRDPEGRSQLIVPLGKIGKTVYVYDSESQSLVEFVDYNTTEFLHLAPLEHWQARYEAPAAQDGVHWTKAKNDLIQTAKRIGIFDCLRVRGGGMWE